MIRYEYDISFSSGSPRPDHACRRACTRSSRHGRPERHDTKLALHRALKLTVCKLTFDEMVAILRRGGGPCSRRDMKISVGVRFADATFTARFFSTSNLLMEEREERRDGSHSRAILALTICPFWSNWGNRNKPASLFPNVCTPSFSEAVSRFGQRGHIHVSRGGAVIVSFC